ncbi:LamG domain-containing protein [Streptomyces sp. SP18BB07]|uniref:LamG domain-containing protein n=1 Tax=Streptomyces sp. SP18BB07 TaxID=3002522 RepID=UPI002E76D284|nr:LamG domain-containing protein [Streptomyces sp. SP18BB07]MEE1757898.1 LamG domain-containing protein [Streptomyces sp. SP18BB07]
MLTTAAPAQAEITDGLLLRYKLDETSGTVAQDSSGHGRDGTVNGTAGWDGDGMAFNGSNTYVKMPNNIMAGLNSITVAFDVWIDPSMGKPYFFYGLGNTSGSSGNGYLFTTGNTFRTSVSMTDYTAKKDIQPSDASYQLARGMWKHVTYTQTGNTGILFENGVEKARNTNVTVAPGAIGGGTTTANYLGRSLYSSDLYFKGRMRDFRVYNRALSTSEVQAVATGTEQQWEQLQALASHNGALAAFEDPDIGPVVIFPSDYTGDIDDLQTPPDWTNEFGQTPTDWPTPATAKSPLFTLDQITDLQDAVTAQIQPDGDTSTYQLNVFYDGMHDRVVAQTDAPASVTDPLTTQYAGKLVLEDYAFEYPVTGKCTPENRTAGSVLSRPAAPETGFKDALTKLQWQQVQALADYNCALAAFDDPTIGPVLIFPSDYTGDIDDLQTPPGWTSEYGEIPADWPVPTTAKSPQFTLEQITEIQDAVIREVSADGDTTAYSVGVHYDGMHDRVVVETDAPASVTDPLLTAYPDRVVIETVSAPTPADTADSEELDA